MKIKRSILCLACSAVLAVLTLSGLWALKPVQPDHPAFFLPLLLSIVFAISFVICWYQPLLDCLGDLPVRKL